jgi:hypothetical protein
MNGHGHATVSEAGRCPTCRQRNVDLCSNDRYGFVLVFPETEQIALVRQPSPMGGDAVTTAWATGCNPGGWVAYEEIDPDRPDLLGLPWFTLLGRPWSTPWLAEP